MEEREDNILGLYGIEIKQFSRISENEEIELSKKSLKGDLIARDKLVTSNLKLVIHIAKYYVDRSYLSFDDLVCEGNKGLITAAEKYDYNFGARFSTYAAWWIKEAITSALKSEYKNGNCISYETNIFDESKNISSDILSRKQDLKIYQNTIVEDNENEAVEDLYKDVLLYLDELTPKESKIIKHYYGIEEHDEMNIVELSEKYGLTNMRISKIIDESLRKIRCKHLERISR
jgi:RNA polymerase primary sigma factor